ncbi:hypothetical protein [Streptomyces sp. MNU76]|nr:hypothetical protein [Streptomyces sp. MNU76]
MTDTAAHRMAGRAGHDVLRIGAVPPHLLKEIDRALRQQLAL